MPSQSPRCNCWTTVPGARSSSVMTRRHILQQASWIVAGATIPSNLAVAAQDTPTGSAAQSVSPVMTKLSTYMSEAQDKKLPEEVIEKAKQHILDTLAAMVSGSELAPGRVAIRFAREYGGQKVATVVASDILCGPIEAAMVNAESAHSDETDDYDPRGGGHPGCAVVPAALALAEQFGASGTHFLRAVMLGYEVGLRVSNFVGTGSSVKDTHIMFGTFGAAAAGGCITGLSTRQMRWLLDYAAQQSASGTPAWRRDTEHIEKGFVFAGAGARNGVTAALLVHSGWTGLEDIFSGPDNFLQSYAPQVDPSSLTEKLGERFEVFQVNIKKWSVGGPIQPVLDALENILAKNHFDAEKVQKINVRLSTNGAATVSNREMPDICLQHLVAVMLMDKTVSFHAAHDRARMQDPAILRLRAKVEVHPDEEFQRLNPRRVAAVEVTLTDGTLLTDRVEAVRGTVENPMTTNEVSAKARDLMAPVLGQQRCDALIKRIVSLESQENMQGLRPLLVVSA